MVSLQSMCPQLWLKTTISKKKLHYTGNIYMVFPCYEGANHIKKLCFHQKWHFRFLIIWHKIAFMELSYFLWNWFEIFQCIYMIFLQCVSSDAISDQIYVRKLSQWLHLYVFSPVCVIRCGLKLSFHKKKLYHTGCIYMFFLQCVSSNVA